MNWESPYLEIRFELDGLLPRDRKILLPNIKIENYDDEGYRGCDIRLRAANDNLFVESQKTIMAVCGAVAYVHNLGFTITSGEGDDGLPKGYTDADEQILWANDSQEQAVLKSVYECINAQDIYDIQPALYYAKAIKFRHDDYEQAMNVVRFVESIVFALRTRAGQRNVDTKLTVVANQRALLSAGITEDELEVLIELNQLRNQIVGHGTILPSIEDLFSLPITRPKYYEYTLTEGIISTVGMYLGVRMPAVRKLFSLYYSCEAIGEELFIYQKRRSTDT